MKIINGCLGILLLFVGLNASAEAVVRQELRCESQNQKPQTCYVGPYADIQFSYQVSKASCIMGQTMFIGSDSVEVTNGCRAAFQANQTVDLVSEGQRVLELVGDRTFSMRFDNDGTHYVPYYNIRNIRIETQHSQAPCIYAQTYFLRGNQITLTNGCRATFRIAGY